VDDSQGYRLASVVQRDIDWFGWQNQLFNLAAGKSDPLTLRAFAYAMWVTGEPQYVGIRSKAGGAHALVGYRVKGNSIYLADPNLPGNGERRLEYFTASRTFKPYDGAEKAGDPPELYETVRYVGKSAIVNWSSIADAWKTLKAGEAGNGLFPAYVFGYLDQQGKIQLFKNGMTVTQPNLFVFPVIKGKLQDAYYYRDGKLLDLTGKGFSLNPGKNSVGAAIFGMPDPATKEWVYVDFTTLDIVSVQVSIDPPVARALANQDCTFSAVFPNPPAGVRYDWLVDDVRKQTGPSLVYKFRSALTGTFKISLKVYDSEGKVLAEAAASAVIGAPSTTPAASPRPATTTPAPTTRPPSPSTTPAPASSARLAYLQSQKTFYAYLIGGEPTYLQKIAGEADRRVTQTFSYPTGFSNNPVNISWSGTSFTGSSTWTAAGQTWSTTCQGQVSPDGNTLVSLAWSTTLKETSGGTRALKASASNVSLTAIWAGGNVQVNNSVSVPRNEAPGKLKVESDTVTTVSSSKVVTTKTFVSMDWSAGGTPGFVLWWGPS
jgi:hypothetical protein